MTSHGELLGNHLLSEKGIPRSNILQKEYDKKQILLFRLALVFISVRIYQD